MPNITVSSIEPNSGKYKREQESKEDRKKMRPVVKKSALVSTKKSFGRKMAQAFIGEEVQDLKKYFIVDVLIPGIKNTILDLISMMFFNESYRGRGRSKDKKYKTSYSSYYDDKKYTSSKSSNRRAYDYDDDKVDYRDIVLRDRRDAEEIVDNLKERIREYGSASIADLYDLIEMSGKYTDNDWGWDDERDIGVKRVSSGFLIDVAEAKYIG